MNYKQLAFDVHRAQNQVRTNPKSFVPKLEEMLQYFDGTLYRKPGKIPLRTSEGAAAVQECIDFLKSTEPTHELSLHDGIVKACEDHVNDIGPKGSISHQGSDGSSFSERMERYGDWMGNIGENCDFGGETGEEIVISLLVDDGNKSRGHRKNMFNPKFKHTGIGCAKHQECDHCCVIDYASEYNAKGQKGEGSWNNNSNINANVNINTGGASRLVPGASFTQSQYIPSGATAGTSVGSAGLSGITSGISGLGLGPQTTNYTPYSGDYKSSYTNPPTSNSYTSSYTNYSTSKPSTNYSYGTPTTQPTSDYRYGTSNTQPTSDYRYGTPNTTNYANQYGGYTTQSTTLGGLGSDPLRNSGLGGQGPNSSYNYNAGSRNAEPLHRSGYGGVSTEPLRNSGLGNQTSDILRNSGIGARTVEPVHRSGAPAGGNYGNSGNDEQVKSTFETKRFGDSDLLNDPIIAQHLSKLKVQSDYSGDNLRELARKEAPAGSNGWSIDSVTEIKNGQKSTKVNITYKFPDGSTQQIIKEFLEGS